MITAGQVVALLGRTGDADASALAAAALPVATAQVRAYTRGNGFSGDQPTPDLDAVILTTAARLTSNPSGIRSEKVGEFETQYQVVNGWTLGERAILNRYRRKAQ